MMTCHSSSSSWRKAYEVDILALGLGNDIGNKEIGNYTLINGKLLVFSVLEWICTLDLVDGSLKKVVKHKQGRFPQLKPYANTSHSCGKFDQPIEEY